MDKVTDEYKSLYEENGGNPHLDGAYSTAGTGHTVFAQVFEGMDVVREIMQVETDDNDMPLTEVTILSAEIVPYVYIKTGRNTIWHLYTRRRKRWNR